MFDMRPQKISTRLILLMAVLLCLGLFMAIFVNRIVADLKDDAEIINQVGVIRGAMQRLVKLELYEQDRSDVALMQSIDQLLERFVKNIKAHPRAREKEIVFHIRKTAENWQELKKSLLQYRSAPSARTRQQLLAKSEECWQAADAAVFAAQQLTEHKVGGIRFFYFVLALNAANALLVLWILYVYVRKKIEYQATFDSLTNLLNRHSFEKELENETLRSKRYNHPFSLIIFDIDYFKRVNDRHGHKAGDQLLAALGKLVQGMMRKSDKVFRIGGEEFAVLASETPGTSAVKLAEKIRHEVENYNFELHEKVTVSLGVAEFTSESSAGDLFRNADAALYRAKEGGRNQTQLFA